MPAIFLKELHNIRVFPTVCMGQERGMYKFEFTIRGSGELFLQQFTQKRKGI